MKKYEVQYLVGFESGVPYCKSQESYRNLLSTIDKLQIKNQAQLAYKDIIISFKIKSHVMNNSKMKYYSTTFSIKNEEAIDQFSEFLSHHRRLITNVSTTEIENTWNDLSLYYSQKSYPIIFNLENLMRKLITTFMTLNVGEEWIKINVPSVVKDSMKKDIRKIRSNFLNETDFIKLSDFLFKKYNDNDIDEFYKLVNESEGSLLIEDLQEFVPKSNWERYFSEIVKCEDLYILKRWEKLYELRCKVAHNNHVLKSDYEQICKYSEEIGKKMIEALDNIDNISLTDDDRDEISQRLKETKHENCFISNKMFSNKFATNNMTKYLINHLKSNEDLMSDDLKLALLENDNLMELLFELSYKEIVSERNQKVHNVHNKKESIDGNNEVSIKKNTPNTSEEQ